MQNSEKAADPSMDEILESIRKIISEDSEPVSSASTAPDFAPTRETFATASSRKGAVSDDDLSDILEAPDQLPTAPPDTSRIDSPRIMAAAKSSASTANGDHAATGASIPMPPPPEPAPAEQADVDRDTGSTSKPHEPIEARTSASEDNNPFGLPLPSPSRDARAGNRDAPPLPNVTPRRSPSLDLPPQRRTDTETTDNGFTLADRIRGPEPREPFFGRAQNVPPDNAGSADVDTNPQPSQPFFEPVGWPGDANQPDGGDGALDRSDPTPSDADMDDRSAHPGIASRMTPPASSADGETGVDHNDPFGTTIEAAWAEAAKGQDESVPPPQSAQPETENHRSEPQRRRAPLLGTFGKLEGDDDKGSENRFKPLGPASSRSDPATRPSSLETADSDRDADADGHGLQEPTSNAPVPDDNEPADQIAPPGMPAAAAGALAKLAGPPRDEATNEVWSEALTGDSPARAPKIAACPAASHAPEPVQPQTSATTGSDPASAASARTLEDTVSDLLRPMLRDWLNENMPRMVEKALKNELSTGHDPSAGRASGSSKADDG